MVRMAIELKATVHIYMHDTESVFCHWPWQGGKLQTEIIWTLGFPHPYSFLLLQFYMKTCSCWTHLLPFMHILHHLHLHHWKANNLCPHSSLHSQNHQLQYLLLLLLLPDLPRLYQLNWLPTNTATRYRCSSEISHKTSLASHLQIPTLPPPSWSTQ